MVFRDLQKLNDLIELKVARLGFAKNESLQLGRRIGAQVIFLNAPSEEPIIRLRLVDLVMVAQFPPRTPPSSIQDSIVSGKMVETCVYAPMYIPEVVHEGLQGDQAGAGNAHPDL